MAGHIVRIENHTYLPSSLSIQRGDTVVWENDDAMSHTATRAEDPKFDTGLIRSGTRSSAITFDVPTGTYGYICRPHPFMHGQIVVS